MVGFSPPWIDHGWLLRKLKLGHDPVLACILPPMAGHWLAIPDIGWPLASESRALREQGLPPRPMRGDSCMTGGEAGA